MAAAQKESDSTLLFKDGHVLRTKVWKVPRPVPPSEHRFKYGEREEPYTFVNPETLVADFLEDVRQERGEGTG